MNTLVTNIRYVIDRILYPPGKVMFVFWTWACIVGRDSSEPVTFDIIIFGYVFMCGIANLLYIPTKKRRQAYKLKVKNKRLKRLNKPPEPEPQLTRNRQDIPRRNTTNGTAPDYGLFFISSIQRKYNLEYNVAKDIMNKLYNAGYVSQKDEVNSYKLLRPEFMVWEYIENNCNLSQAANFDSMDGHQFEYFCADLLRNNGFKNVQVTQGSGDHGIDVLAEKDDITYAIQCKCYSNNIGNAAVQQAHTGKSLYHKDVAVVMTNRYFTRQAKAEAAELGVKLWDRDKILAMNG